MKYFWRFTERFMQYQNRLPIFDELVANAELNERGEKVIKFLEYECEHDTMQAILDEAIAKYKIKGHRAKAFQFSFWLGCSPKTKAKS